MKSIRVLIFCFLLFTNFLTAQEMIGIANSNYSGIIGTFINPANVVGSPMQREINIFSGDLSAHNNYIYIPKGEFYKFNDYKGAENEHGIMIDKYTVTPDKHAYGNVMFIGPSIMYSSKKNGFAIHTAFRNNFSVRDLNYHLAKFMWDGFDYGPQHAIPFQTTPYQAVIISYYEIGLTGGAALINNQNSYLTIGGTLNIDLSTNSFYMRSQKMDYIVPNSYLLVVNDLVADYGHTMTAPETKIGDYLSVKGFGGGINFGMNYIANRNDKAYSLKNDARKKYDFRIGATILDAGALNFNKNAVVFNFKNDSAYWPGIDSAKFASLYELDTAINNHFTGSPDGAYEKDNYTLYLPTAVSVQFDYAIYPRVYGYFTAIQRIGFSEMQVKRGNQLVVGGRYERAKWEAGIQYSLYEYKWSRIGVSFRYKWFFIGSSTASAVTSLFNMYGIDVYFGFKLTNWNKARSSGTVDDCFTY